MYFFTCLLFAITEASLEAQTLPVGAQVGETCNADTYFHTNSFEVYPWPPQKNRNVTFNMTGTFSIEEKVNQVSIMTNFNRRDWHFQYEIVDKIFKVGETTSFVYNIPISNVTGNYLEQITLEKFDPNHHYVGCWQFSYYLV